MQITILSVTVEHMPGKNGGYDKAEVAYKDHEGKVAGKNLVSFNAPEAFAVVKAAVHGDVLDVTAEKDAKGYWQWVKAVKLDAAAAAAQQVTQTTVAKNGAANVVVKNTYETPEERAAKQLSITRQFSINAAIEYSKSVKTLKSIDEVLEVAKVFEAHVYREAPTAAAFDNFQDDSKDVIQ